MAKYLIIDEREADTFVDEHEELDHAIREASYYWSHMSDHDKKACNSFYVLESVNPDEEAENHLDGNPVFRWKYNGKLEGFYTACKETGDFIDRFDSLREAENAIDDYEYEDKDNDCFKENYYTIVDWEHKDVYKIF